MKITVVGLGYVGVVSAACLASQGNEVWGVDINPAKVKSLSDGKSPIVEPGLEKIVAETIASGHLRATCSIDEALQESVLCLVSVATPSLKNGQINASYLLGACRQIASSLKKLGRKQIVVIRSSVLPHVFDDAAALFDAEAPGHADLCVNPEFLREGTAIADFRQPPFTLIGANSPAAEAVLRELYSSIDAPILLLKPKEATLVKYASNAYHALKVAFTNEISAICHVSGADAEAVMKVFCEDKKLNISSHYLRPGFAFGGSCLPKDVRALLHVGRLSDIELPLMTGVLESNSCVIDRAVQAVLDAGVRRVGLVGLSFKKNTDDLRESPFVEVAEQLIGKGLELKVYDPNVSVAKLVGANRDYIVHSIPHLSRVLVDSLDEVTDWSELVIIAHNFDGIETVHAKSHFDVLDLTKQTAFKKRGDPLLV
jgi:GDP-mannose 6-dehydrogenase